MNTPIKRQIARLDWNKQNSMNYVLPINKYKDTNKLKQKDEKGYATLTLMKQQSKLQDQQQKVHFSMKTMKRM